MPAAVCPSFHCRPSTTSTLLLPSLSIRQTPTTLTNDFGSAPTVSSEKSTFRGCAAPAYVSSAARPAQAAAIVMVRLFVVMVDLRLAIFVGRISCICRIQSCMSLRNNFSHTLVVALSTLFAGVRLFSSCCSDATNTEQHNDNGSDSWHDDLLSILATPSSVTVHGLANVVTDFSSCRGSKLLEIGPQVRDFLLVLDGQDHLCPRHLLLRVRLLQHGL